MFLPNIKPKKGTHMNEFKLNKPQLQAALNNLVEEKSGLNTLMEITLNAFMKAERDQFLPESVNNKGNGFRKVNGLGISESLALRIPRDRLSQFKPLILEIMRESNTQLEELCFELYYKGLTTREIEEITENIYGKKLSKSKISNINKTFYKDMELFRKRQIDSHYPIIYIDATFINTKRVDSVSKEAYYIVLGVKQDMTREIIGIYNQPTESASHWKEIFGDLKQRGLKECDLLVSDNLSGINSVVELQFKDITIQQCVLHLKRNVLRKTLMKHRREIADDLKVVFDMDNADDTQEKAFERANTFAQKWSKHYSHIKKFSDENEMRYYFSYLKFDHKIRRMIYTTNWIERFNKNIKRTTKIRNSMPSIESVLTLISKVASEQNNNTYSYPIYNLQEDKLFQNPD